MFVFSTYLIVLLIKFQSEELVGCGIWFCIQQVPTLHTFDGPHYPKKRNTWKNVMMTSSSHFLGISCFWGKNIMMTSSSCFSGISCFRGSEACEKYVEWVLVGCIIKFHIQLSLSIKIWVKTQGYMLKKVVFSFLPPKLINIILLF